jgi:hypothetical protein
MFDSRHLDDAERMVDDWQTGVESRAEQARALSRRLSGLTASAESDDGLVKLAVGSTGAMVRLELAEGIRGRPAAETAQTIMTTLRTARRNLTTAVGEVTRETVGAESATGRAVIASYAERMCEADD